jgi:hypothetical protein
MKRVTFARALAICARRIGRDRTIVNLNAHARHIAYVNAATPAVAVNCMVSIGFASAGPSPDSPP